MNSHPKHLEINTRRNWIEITSISNVNGNSNNTVRYNISTYNHTLVIMFWRIVSRVHNENATHYEISLGNQWKRTDRQTDGRIDRQTDGRLTIAIVLILILIFSIIVKAIRYGYLPRSFSTLDELRGIVMTNSSSQLGTTLTMSSTAFCPNPEAPAGGRTRRTCVH